MTKRVYVAHTGGTIGMKQTGDGYKPQRGYLQKLMRSIPELSHASMPAFTIHDYDPLLDSRVRHVLTRHEQGAGHAAEGYAWATGRVGVCIATSGPADRSTASHQVHERFRATTSPSRANATFV